MTGERIPELERVGQTSRTSIGGNQKGKRGKDMKTFKKVLASALAAAMVVTAFPVANAEAASTAKLSATKATLYVGQSKTLKVTTPKTWKSVKVKATSSKKSVASVKKSGKKVTVKAVKAGTAKVTVKVTAKKAGKKVSKTLKATVTVKNPSLTLKAANEVAVGATEQITATVKPASTKVTYASSDATIATVDEKGVVTGVKAGDVTITAKAGKTSKTVKMTVKNYVLQSVKQTKANTLEASILGATKNIKTTDVKITNTANQNVIAVKSVTPDKADASKVTLETFADMKDGAKYTVELDGVAKEFTATDGVVADVNVTPVTIPANTKGTEIKGQTIDKNGIVLDEFKVSEASTKSAELTLSTTQGYVDGNKLVLPTVGNKGTAEVKYHTYKFDANGNEIGAYTKKVDITAVAEDVITTNGFNMTFADKAPNWDKDKTTNQLAIGSNKSAYFKFVGSDNKEITAYADYSVVSSDDSILLLPKTQLSSSSIPVSATGIKEGNVFVNVLDKDGKVIKSLPVVVTAAGKLTNTTLGNTSLTISKTATGVDNSVSVKAVDQYNNDITDSTTITASGVNDDATKAIDADYNRATKTVKVSAKATAEDGKTYTIKVEVKKDNVTLNRYFTVKTVTTATDVAKATDLRVEVSGLTDGKVDMAVADDADAAKAAKTVEVKVAAYDKGAKIGYANVTECKISDSSKQSVVSGAAVSVVSCSGKKVSKNLEAGKSYTLTVKAAGKTFTTTFSVVDTQSTTVTTKIDSKTTSETITDTKEAIAKVVAANVKFSINGKDYETFNASEITVNDGYKVVDNKAVYVGTVNVSVENTNGISYPVTVNVNTTFTAK